jgi:hypothetical protein
VIEARTVGKSNKYVFNGLFLVVHFISSHQMQANPNPGQFWMSYSNGFAGSSPKFASRELFGAIVTVGKRRSTVGVMCSFQAECVD